MSDPAPVEFDPVRHPAIAAWNAHLMPGRQGQDPLQPDDGALYLDVMVGVPGMLAVAQAVMPALIEVDGMILLASRYSSANFADWRHKLGDDRATIGRILNRFVVWDRFLAPTPDPDADPATGADAADANHQAADSAAGAAAAADTAANADPDAADIAANADPDVADAELEAADWRVAEFVATCWRARAAEVFPGRPVVVEVFEGYGPTVAMYEPNPSPQN